MTGKGLSVSPDGEYVAFEVHQADVATNHYRVAWFVAPINSAGRPVNVGVGGDPTLFRSSLPSGRRVGTWISEYAKWSPDSRGIVYRKKVNGEIQLWWSARDGSLAKQLTHNPADVEEFHWSLDGSEIYFLTDADRAALRDADDDRARNGHVLIVDKNWSTIDGEPLDRAYSLTGGKPRVWVLDIRSGVESLATDDELVEFRRQHREPVLLEHASNARSASIATDRSGVAWIQPDDPDKQGTSPPQTVYASQALDGSDATRCPATECTGILDDYSPLRTVIHWDSVADEVIFARSEGLGYSRRTLYAWRIGDKHARRILSTDKWLSDCSVVRGRAVCFRETPSYPRTIVSINLRDGAIETLVDPNPEFKNITLGNVELMEWVNEHGIGTFGYLVTPPHFVPEKRYPMVVVGYRARWALRGGVGEEYPVHLLAKNDFVVLVYQKPTNFDAFERARGSIEVGKAIWGELFDVRMPMSSFESIVRRLDDSGLIDPERVAITGFSAGIGDVNYSLIHSDLFAAAIASGSEYGPNKRFLSGSWTEELVEYSRAIGMGPYPGPHGFLFPQMSLSLNARRVQAPLLINSSDHEYLWALEEVISLLEHGRPVEMVVYPDEGHVKWHPAHRFSIYERNVDWLNFWLRGIEDSNPEKSGQYARWHLLRKLNGQGEAVAELGE